MSLINLSIFDARPYNVAAFHEAQFMKELLRTFIRGFNKAENGK